MFTGFQEVMNGSRSAEEQATALQEAWAEAKQQGNDPDAGVAEYGRRPGRKTTPRPRAGESGISPGALGVPAVRRQQARYAILS